MDWAVLPYLIFMVMLYILVSNSEHLKEVKKNDKRKKANRNLDS